MYRIKRHNIALHHIFLLFLALTPVFIHSQEEAHSKWSEVPNHAKTPILNPTFQDQETLKIKLKNGLEVLLISDPNSEQSACSMTVDVGSWDDPKEHPGLAHFLEHMLFLGTKKYPEESGFKRFIEANGGTYNAFTSDRKTAYMFSIDHTSFPQAIDRFSQFFISPLFNSSGTNRELHAIDQEFAKNLENDSWREYQVYAELANPHHPFSQFGMGNSRSLKDVSPEILRNWYESKYSSHKMHLILISKEPLEELKGYVLNSFLDIPLRVEAPLDVPPRLSSPLRDGTLTYIQPLHNINKLTLQWELPQEFVSLQDTKPHEIASHIIGHEGKHSLLALLKKEGLAESLSSGSHIFGNNNLIFQSSIHLTEKGIEQLDLVILRFFQAIDAYKKLPPPSYILDEIEAMQRINYQYQTRKDVYLRITQLASIIVDEQLSTFPEKNFLLTRKAPEQVQEFLSYLSPKTCQMTLTSKHKKISLPLDKKESWMQVAYSVNKIAAEKISKWIHPEDVDTITYPEVNPFIPESLSVKGPSAAFLNREKKPILVKNLPSTKIYFCPDSEFFIPEVHWSFRIKIPQIDQGSAKDQVMAELYTRFVHENLNTFSYLAYVAGLNFNLNASDYGIHLEVFGYSDKASLLLKKTLQTLKAPIFSEEQFLIYHNSLQRQYHNEQEASPLKQASEVMKQVLHRRYHSIESKQEALSQINYSDFLHFAAIVMDNHFVQGMLVGNMDLQDAQDIHTLISKEISQKPYPYEDHRRNEVFLLPKSKGPFYLNTHSTRRGNAVILMIEDSPFSFKSRASQQILSQMLQEPFFSELRTKQQTGYIVFNWDKEIERQLLNFFAVQSDSHDCRDLLARFELFLEGFLHKSSQDDTQKSFNSIKQSLIHKYESPLKNLQEQAMRWETLAFDYDEDFEWISKRIEGFKNLNFSEWLAYTRGVLGKHNKRRLAILMHGTLSDKTTFQYTNLQSKENAQKQGQYVSR